MKSKLPSVILSFLDGKPGMCGSLKSTGHDLFSFDTVIASWAEDTLVFNDTYYSTVTSKHQGMLRRMHKETELRIVLNVPIGTKNLKPHILVK